MAVVILQKTVGLTPSGRSFVSDPMTVVLTPVAVVMNESIKSRMLLFVDKTTDTGVQALVVFSTMTS